MAKKKRKPKKRNALVSVMRKRFPRVQKMQKRGKKRQQDAKNSWRNEWD